jgi:DNA replication and repair protein RecF
VPGVVLVVGRNGVGKTNLLESLHVATQGFSPRTRQDGQLIQFGESAARVTVAGERAATPVEASLTLRAGQAKEARVNGARLPSAESLRREFATLVFTPDRLTVVKGGPAARRAYFDRVIGRMQPARAEVPQEYLSALAQRNAALRRIQLRVSPADVLPPWTERVAAAGAALVDARRTVLDRLGPAFAERAEELGLPGARLLYEAEPPTVAALDARLQRDIDRGVTGLGPHLDDVLITSDGRDLRQFGSQGEQRLAVLSLLLAEAELLDTPPLLLLDDVLSELDPGRRKVLVARVATMGQTVITATHAGALPVEPAQLVEVEHGSAR